MTDLSTRYPCPISLARATEQIAAMPPLVTSWEVERLRHQLAQAARGERFLLIGGDCAESFAETNSAAITAQLKILLQLSLIISDGLKKPLIRVGRIAGQFAKPRTSPVETRELDGKSVVLPSYLGDLINGPEFTAESRTPDPGRLLQGYHHSAIKLNFIRSLVEGGFADLRHPEFWDFRFLGTDQISVRLRDAYRDFNGRISQAVAYLEDAFEVPSRLLTRVDFYTAHEGLSLDYESALTRNVPRREGRYDLSCHLPWIGDRTRHANGEHVRFFSEVRNPVGVKLGPTATAEEVCAIAEALDPHREPGRLVLMARLGADRAAVLLPPLVEAVQATGRMPLWVCDPMHGNTELLKNGRKTRRFDAILQELQAHQRVHAELGTVFGGIHIEVTGQPVCECIGGASGVTEDQLTDGYRSLCDPRLNAQQALELAFFLRTHLTAGE